MTKIDGEYYLNPDRFVESVYKTTDEYAETQLRRERRPHVLRAYVRAEVDGASRSGRIKVANTRLVELENNADVNKSAAFVGNVPTALEDTPVDVVDYDNPKEILDAAFPDGVPSVDAQGEPSADESAEKAAGET